jgi:hypothetical protein
MNIRRILITSTLVAAAILWAGTVGAMFRAMRKFEATPGRAANPLAVWPNESRIPRTPGEWRLVMLVHPHCSCSRASISELQRIIEKSPRSLQTYVVIYRPSEFPAGWEKTDVFVAASHLPRTHLVLDQDGHEASIFHGFTSGQTYLYDGAGKLRFSGGITLLRGEAGFNKGSAEVMEIANTRSGTATHPVFGCAINQ